MNPYDPTLERPRPRDESRAELAEEIFAARDALLEAASKFHWACRGCPQNMQPAAIESDFVDHVDEVAGNHLPRAAWDWLRGE